MLNCAVIMGRITANPDFRQTQSGISVARFSVAVDRPFAHQGEERQADFINIVAWRGAAEFVEKYFRKGSMIAIQGHIQTGLYEDKKTGEKRRTFEVIADNVSFCGSKTEGGDMGNTQRQQSAAAPAFSNGASADDFAATEGDDDLPF